jgi:DNA-binding response OmpR family regulator
MKPSRILCVGNHPDLLSTRCDVLASEGHEARSVQPSEAEPALEADRFDLVVLCGTLNDFDQQQIRDFVPHGTQILTLKSFNDPRELIARVAQLLGERPRDRRVF